MSEQVQREPELRIEAVFKQREDREKNNWQKKAFIKLLEIIGFLGTFLCTNPIGFTFSVILVAIALALDFGLHYYEWKNEREFQSLFA